MADAEKTNVFVFPKWANYIVPLLLLGGMASVPYKILLAGYALSPQTLNVNYQPEQPIPYSHELHVGQLGMDCRYCHTSVDKAKFAAIPPTGTCMNCHTAIHPESPNLEKLRESWKKGTPVEWKKVHDLPDYAYFAHDAHVNRGVSCVSCHGRVDKMGGEGVYQAKSLSMGWCLSCHRDPAPNIRPLDQVYNLNWGFNLRPSEIAQIKTIVPGMELSEGGKLTDDQRRAIGEALIVKRERRQRGKLSSLFSVPLSESHVREVTALKITGAREGYWLGADALKKLDALTFSTKVEERAAVDALLLSRYNLRTHQKLQDCSTCHR